MCAENKSAGGGKPRAYHHGELKSALIAAADAILRDNGVEGFSLRDAARRAGVSPGAPAHHFGNASGLLTELAILGYEDLHAYLAQAPATGTPSAHLRALAGCYVRFALDHPGRFRLMFRKDLINRDDARYKQSSQTALLAFADAAAAHAGTSRAAMAAHKAFAPVLAVWASAHGIAHLALEDKMAALLDPADPTGDFLTRLLPDILAAQWPDAG